MTITNSTISGNSARRNGGGVGAFYSNVTIRHSTVTGNRADSDANATGNGGGVFVTSTQSNLTLNHTIVAGNLRQASTRDDISGAVVASSAFNLVGVNTGLTGISNGTNGNQIGTGAAPIDALLGPLAVNGGLTLTHAFLAGSSAIDAGDPAFSPPPTNDQRGAPFLRVADGDGIAGARIDIGAYEQPSFVVDTLADELDFDFSAGHLSLREAIALANASTVPDTITFAEALTSGGPATILLTLGELAISRELSIIGPGSDLLTIDASGNDPTPSTNNGDGSRVFHIENASVVIDVSISGLTLTGGDCSEGGGAVFNTENLTVGACTISDNYAASGGGVFSMDSSLTISDSTISGNHATFDGESEGAGGGIVCLYDLVAISNSTISGNTATGNGGGILGFVTLRHSTVTGNIADADNDGNGRGGGIHQILPPQYTGVVLDHTIVAKNTRVNGTRDDINGGVEAHYSLIGDNSGSSVFNDGTNLIGTVLAPIDPLLGPLADNGGPTMTHALLVGSPAIDAGNSSFNPADPDGNPLTNDAVPNDQRGAPFDRVFDGNSNGTARIDIGAYELQPKGILGDYNLNGTVDAADYVVWRKSLSTSVSPPFTGADGDGDGIVDADDHGVWRANFGNVPPPPGAGSGAGGNDEPQAASLGLAPGQSPTSPMTAVNERVVRLFAPSGTSITTLGRSRVLSSGQQLAGGGDHQLLLALDVAMAEFDLDPGHLNGTGNIDDAEGEPDELSAFDDLLALDVDQW